MKARKSRHPLSIASAMTSSGWRARRFARSLIWCRHDVPGATTSASGSSFRAGSSDRSAILHAQVVVLLLEAERAGHAAAAGVEHAARPGRGPAARPLRVPATPHQRLLMAVAVQHASFAGRGDSGSSQRPAVSLRRQPGVGQVGGARRCAASSGPGTSSGHSSTRVSRQLGSRPRIGVPSATRRGQARRPAPGPARGPRPGSPC